jgi:hypothetical protein
MFSTDPHRTPPSAAHSPASPIEPGTDPSEREERRHEALRRFGYDPAAIYALAGEALTMLVGRRSPF